MPVENVVDVHREEARRLLGFGPSPTSGFARDIENRVMRALSDRDAELARLRENEAELLTGLSHDLRMVDARSWDDVIEATRSVVGERDQLRAALAERTAEVEQLKATFADATAYCSGEWPCEASTSAASLERERNELEQVMAADCVLHEEKVAEIVVHVAVLRGALEQWVAHFDRLYRACDRDDPLRQATADFHRARMDASREALALSPPAALAKWRAVVEAAQRVTQRHPQGEWGHGSNQQRDCGICNLARALADPAVAPLKKP